MGKYDYRVFSEGMKEYIIEFEDAEDAERAYELAEIWHSDFRGVYEPCLDDKDLYIVCRNDTLHWFMETLVLGEN